MYRKVKQSNLLHLAILGNFYMMIMAVCTI